MKYKFILYGILSCALFINFSCATTSKNLKSESEFLSEIDNKTEQISGKELDLNDCLKIALENNLALKKSDLQKQISAMDRKIAFSSFLPQVNLNFSYRDWKHQPETLVSAGSYRTVQDRTIAERSIEIQMPIFVPATWLVYSTYKRGEKISGILNDYTAQMISLQTAISYYKCLQIEESEKYLVSQISAAKSLLKDFELRKSEGLLLDWQVEELKVYLMSQYAELNRLSRNRRTGGAELLNNLGLSPLSEIKIKQQTELKPPAEPLDELILFGLKNHPQAQIARENILIAEDKAKIAITNFLPILMGFANFSHTNNDFNKFANQTLHGLSGVMTVFNGFRNIREYQKARIEAKNVYLKQEELFLSIMLQVLESYNNLKDAEDSMKVAEKNLEVEERRLVNIREKNNENIAGSTELLQAIAGRDYAYSTYIKTKYNMQMMTAALYNSIGKNYYELSGGKAE